MEKAAELHIDVMSHPWWDESPRDLEERKISLYFSELRDARIFFSDFGPYPSNEFLEDFRVRRLEDLEWARGSWRQIYCSQAIPDPLSIHAALHDFLVSMDCPYGPDHYLNMGDHHRLSDFLGICASGNFLFCDAPPSICDLMAQLLEKQGVEISSVERGDLSGSLSWVGLGQSHFVCQSAYAVFQE
ncbi:MAG: hypothetical protein ACTS3R_09160 [Inquilinaceae bacterium]